MFLFDRLASDLDRAYNYNMFWVSSSHLFVITTLNILSYFILSLLQNYTDFTEFDRLSGIIFHFLVLYFFKNTNTSMWLLQLRNNYFLRLIVLTNFLFWFLNWLLSFIINTYYIGKVIIYCLIFFVSK